MSIQYLVYEPMAWTKSIYTILVEGKCRWSGKTVETVQAEKPNDTLVVVDEPEFEKRYAAYIDSMRTNPKPITKSRWWEALEVLPPCRWTRFGTTEVFHVSERLTDDLVDWYIKKGNDYYSCVQDAAIEIGDLLALPVPEKVV